MLRTSGTDASTCRPAADHAIINQHSLSFKTVQIVDHEPHAARRRVKEALHIRTEKNPMNKDRGLELDPIWFTRVKRSLSVVNFKRRIGPSLGAPAVQRSPSARVQAAYNTVYRSTLARQQTNLCRARVSQRCVLRCSVVTCATTLRVTPGSAPSTSPTGGAKDQWPALRCEA